MGHGQPSISVFGAEVSWKPVRGLPWIVLILKRLMALSRSVERCSHVSLTSRYYKIPSCVLKMLGFRLFVHWISFTICILHCNLGSRIAFPPFALDGVVKNISSVTPLITDGMHNMMVQQLSCPSLVSFLHVDRDS